MHSHMFLFTKYITHIHSYMLDIQVLSVVLAKIAEAFVA